MANLGRRLCGWVLPALVLSACSGDQPPSDDAGGMAIAELERMARPQIIATGAAISGANGLQIGPDGLLYVASVIGSELVVMDPRDGTVRRRLTAVDGVAGPDDVAFAPDGAMFWTSILTGEVAGFDAAGDRVVAGNPGPGVNPITFADDGRLFVAQCFFGDGLFELDPKGIAEPRRIAVDLGPRCGLNGMDWGPDDRLYGPRWFRGEVVSVEVETGAWRVEASGFRVPAAVKFDNQGRLHVLDTETGQVLRIDKAGPVEVARLSPGLDNFAFDTHDRLFVSSFADGFVVRVEPDGTVVELSPGGMAHPGGVAILGGAEAPALPSSPTPQVVVADLHALRGFDPETGQTTFVERNILGVGALGSVLEVAVDGPNLILTSFTDNSVRVWSPAERRVLERFDNLALPVSALRYGGQVVATEHGAGRVVALGEGAPRVLAGGLEAPAGLVTDGVSLFVGDRARGEILEIARDGEPIAARRIVGGLEAPEGMAMHDGDIIVVEGQSGRVLRVRDGRAVPVALVAQGSPPASPAQPPSMVFNDVAVLGDVLYVTGETNRVLYRIDLADTAGAHAEQATSTPTIPTDQ